MFTRSQVALILSVRKLFAISKQVYFWTFTFEGVMHDWQYPYAFHIFIRDLLNIYGGVLCGVRVIEVHPGGHGLHYHALFNERISVHLVRRIGARVGIVVVDVKRADVYSAEYLAKYVGKDVLPLAKGLHRWACVGAFRGVKKGSIEIHSDYAVARRRLSVGRIGPGWEKLLRGAFEAGGRFRMAEVWGHLKAGRLTEACALYHPGWEATAAGGVRRMLRDGVRVVREAVPEVRSEVTIDSEVRRTYRLRLVGPSIPFQSV